MVEVMKKKLCKCGCGGVVKPGNTWIHGHNKSTLGYKHSDKTRENMSKGQKKRFTNLKEIELNRQRAIKQFESEEAREIQRQNAIKQWSNQEARDEISRIKLQYYIDHPEENELNRQRQIQYYIDNPEARGEARKKTVEQFSDPDAREKMSAIKQGIPYDEWEGFYQADWRNWQGTILLNDPFPGCHRHHITETLAICIPDALHNHIRHVLETGKNMGEMNILAFQFINGGL
jgi:DNA-binding TFAR19-related protein (PDSD5 family)